MSKSENTTASEQIRVTLSHQSLLLLDQVAEMGIYGRNKAEVAARFIDKSLEPFVEIPKLKLEETKKTK